MYTWSSELTARIAVRASVHRRSTTGSPRGRGRSGGGQRRSGELAVEASRRSGELVVADVFAERHRLALDATVAQHDDDRGEVRGHPDELHAPHGDSLGLGTDHYGRIVGERRQQVGRAVQHLLEPAMGRHEEVADLLGGDVVEPAGRSEVVDEEAVSLVGGHPARRRVRLDEEALLLQHRHVVANGGGRDIHSRRARDVGRAHRLRRCDVLVHDGAENRCLSFVEHGWHFRLPTASRSGRH